MKCILRLYFLLACCIAVSCKAIHPTTGSSSESISRLQFINEVDIPYNFLFRSTTVGGLSGIDYDAKRDQYYLICDDRSAINPSRFYTARIPVSNKGIDSVYFVAVTSLLQANGLPYPNALQDASHVPDPEALRYNAKEDVLVWSSEGERIVKTGGNVLEDPSITAIGKDGKYLYGFDLPANMRMQAIEKGPRRNGVFEGLAFTPDYQTLYVSVEEPVYEDGPRAGLGDSSAWIRMIRYEVATRKPVAQYAYQIDPVAYPPVPAGEFKINGVPDILFISKQHLLVLERSYSTGRLPCTVKLYLADLANASDVSGTASLLLQPAAHPVHKKLLLNMDSLHMYIDNVEGVTFGPVLPNGHKTLILVADNNFEKLEKTQFFLFEIIP